MSKIFTLCLSLLLASASSANAGERAAGDNLMKHRASWRPVSVQGMNVRTSATQQLRAAGLPVAGQPALDASADTVSSVPASGFGWTKGPDGTQWYYTQTFELKPSTDVYSKSVITVYNSDNKEAGKITVVTPDSVEVNQIGVSSGITKKLFDRNDQTSEVVVEMHCRGNAANNYSNRYITRVYNLSGELVYEHEGTGIFFDASKGWNTYQRMLFTRTVSDENGEDVYKIDVLAPPSYGESEPKVEHTFTVPDSLINYSSGSYLNACVVNDKPYYIISHYAKPYVAYYDMETWEMVLNENNPYILKVYDKSFNLVDSLSIPIETPDDALYRFASFGLFSDNDMSEGYFTDKGERAYVITFSDYIPTEDNDTYDFVLFNSKGEKLKTICEDATEDQWWTLSSIKGQSEQMVFLQAVGSSQQLQMVDIPSCEKKTLIPATINGDGITSTLDRYPVGDSYQYVIKMSTADTDADNNTIARIGWYTTDLQLDHMVKINLGQQGEYFTPLINSKTLNPYLFNTDDKMEYLYIAKKMRTDGSGKIDNVLEIANEDGTVLYSWNGDGDYRLRMPSLVEMTSTKTQLMQGLYNDNTEEYRLDFYDLPFTKFDKGGDGTAANPYIVQTVGDMLQINSDAKACYKMANDIDFAAYKNDWLPIANSFEGTFDGDGHTISNLSIDCDEYEVGLFSTVGFGSKISNLTIANPSITVNADNQYVGLIAGESVGDTITNVHIYNANIVAADETNTSINASVGGFIGKATINTVVQTSSFDGNINIPYSSYVGGIGGIYGETMTNSGATACAVTGSIAGRYVVGGVIGISGTTSSVADCHVNAAIKAGNSVGGIVGDNSERGLITRCVVEGSVEATKAMNYGSGYLAGGIAGSLSSPSINGTASLAITNCVSAATIIVPSDATADDLKSVHRIVGKTVANEEESRTDGGLSGNYVVSDDVTYSDAASVDGASVNSSEVTQQMLTELGYAYGSSIAAPWKGNALPKLYFEDIAVAITLSGENVSVAVDEGTDVYATVYGTVADAIDCSSSNADVAEVEITAAEGNVATLHITGKSEGEATITVTAGDVTNTFVVTVAAATGIKAATANQAMVIRLANGQIAAKGASRMAVYSTGGQLSAATVGDTVSTSRLAKGVYVVVATDGNGTKRTAKVVVK